LLRRTGDAALTALVAVVVLIVLVRLLPGDPLATIMGEGARDPAAVAALQARYGLDHSILQSIFAFFGALLHGDLGTTISDGRPVTSVIAERIGPTLLLGGLTLLIDFTVGLALGVWSALHPDSVRAHIVGALTIIGYTIPSFVTGMLLVWIFAEKLSWLPPGDMTSLLLATDAPFADALRDHLAHLALPLAAMVLATIAVPLRQQRAATLAVATQPWVLAARARGVHPAAVAWQHCWRPALTPIVTLLGLWLPMLVTGAVFVEVVFNWPGMGQLLANATMERDVNLVIGAGFVVIIMVQLGSLAADVIYRVVDPAQRTG
jgi:peptide/nickel transport system permease protein